MGVLQLIQTELKAPKGQYNSFGKYKYRSCEDILEAVKPLLAKHKAELTLQDDVINIGDRFYIKATATIIKDGAILGTTTAFAREPDEKKGIDPSQVTGTASSYARKYALNGLFLIDDTKDEDTNELREEKAAREEQKAITSQPQRRTANKDKNPKAPEGEVKSEEEMTKPTDKITAMHVKAVRAKLAKAAEMNLVWPEDQLCKNFKIEKLEDMTFERYLQFINYMDQVMEKKRNENK